MSRSNPPPLDTHAHAYDQFIRMGDADASTSTSASASASTSASASASTSASASANPNPNPNPNPSANPTPNSQPQTTQPSPNNNNRTSSFFSSFFRKATTTLEHSLHAAQQNGSEALNSAQQHVSAASSNALSTVSGLVHDIGTTFNAPNAPNSSTPHPDKTLALKPLRLSPPAIPLLVFRAPAPTVVSQSALHVFSADAPRPLVVPLNVVTTQSRPSSPTSNGPVTAPPHVPVAATHAVLLPPSRLAVAQDDGIVVVFSLSAPNRATFHASTPPHPSPTVALAPLHPHALAIARRDGSVHMLNDNLQPVLSLQPPTICSASLTPTLSSAAPAFIAPVLPLSPSPSPSSSSSPTSIATIVAYDDGVVACFSSTGSILGHPFVAHAGAPAAVSHLFSSKVILTVGNEVDRSLAAFDAATGRCIARTQLPFAPSCLSRTSRPQGLSEAPDAAVCPSASTFLVGGDESQVEVFRAVALSSWKIDIKRVVRIGDRIRGKKRNVLQLVYKNNTGVVTALCKNGEVRQWELCRADAGHLSILPEDVGIGATFTQANVKDKMEQEESSPEQAPLNYATGVTRAQAILATILDDNSVPEEKKDELVTSFQRRQGQMMAALSETETEGRRAKRRVFGRFSSGLNPASELESDLEKQMAIETCRAAALEAEYVTRRYTEKVRNIETTAVEKLREILQNFLKELPPSESLIVEQAMRDVVMLGSEEAEVEVD